jgi:hypothetical protein
MPRAIVEDLEDLQQQEIRLFGSFDINGKTANLFNAERLYYDSELPGWNYDNTQFWIKGAQYRFCAICPYMVEGTYSDADGRVTIEGYVGSSDSPDLMYATSERDLAAAEDYSVVPLNFHHACAAVQFNIVNASNAPLLQVRNLRLVGLQNRGNFTFDTAGNAEWVLDGTTETGDAYAGTCVLPDGGLPVNLNVQHSLYENGALLVLPQSVYKTDITLHLEYLMANSNGAYNKRDIKLGLLGGAAPTEWKAGVKYVYTMTITENTATLDVKVVDWVDHYVDL